MFLQKITLPDPTCASADSVHLAQVARTGFPDRPARRVLAEAARLRIGSHVFQLRTIDISGAGVKLDVIALGAVARDATIFAKGAIALLTIRGMPFPKLGQIRWCNGRHVGFRFDDPIDSAEMTALLAPLDD